ncbi:MAG: protein-disulfide reductase DsbD [Gammaproteobacteria bacterium]|nr:protein-disulfide reductase DsbD [Gammaproteobacteria bacterium]MCI0591441.1 protein-disulfide reductase DsbD [Gammaproteobacteria bacterium]
MKPLLATFTFSLALLAHGVASSDDVLSNGTVNGLTPNPTADEAPAPKENLLQEVPNLDEVFNLGPQPTEFLDADKAFMVTAVVDDPNTLTTYWQIADGYYLYRDKFKFKVKGGTVALQEVALPQGEIKEDPTFGRVKIIRGATEIKLALIRSAPPPAQIELEIGYQGCAEDGICYPPITKVIALRLDPVMSPAAATTVQPRGGVDEDFISEQQGIAHKLASGNTFLTLLSFLGFGLLLAFTPCVFPMVPILSGIIVGHGERITTAKAFNLSLVYVLAMALTYAVIGVLAGSSGDNLQALFQKPWVLLSFSALFVALALSMFGFYHLQLPASLQSRLWHLSEHQDRGTLHGAAVMGSLSALIVGPCVAPPLLGALLYISQTGNALLGGAALLAMGLGFGIPLLIVGTSAGKLLPKVGHWMDVVQRIFGVVLLGVAIWFMERVLPPSVTLLLWASLLIVSAVYMGALDGLERSASGWRRLWKGVGLTMLIYGVVLVLTAASGGGDVLKPLIGTAFVGSGDRGAQAGLQFTEVKGLPALANELAKAKAQRRPAVLDLYADWCVTCKELETYTFSDPGVQQTLAEAALLRADVTANDHADRALLKQLQLFGPPAILFYGSDAVERRPYRLAGFVGPDAFREHARKALAP